jgi:Flp pilus assembly pilin Flp
VRPAKLTWRREQGAAAVEFALVIPVILLLSFAIIEFGFIVRDKVAITHLTRDASRTASSLPRLGNVDGHQGNPPPAGQAPVGAVASFAYFASEVVEASSSGLPKNSILDFWVYLPNRDGFPTQTANWQTDTNRTMTCAVDEYCVRYRWVDGTGGNPGRFRYVSGAWDPLSIDACPGATGQAVGVYLRVDHRGFFTNVFNSNLTLTDRNVVKFEPLPARTCAPTP